ncbi:Rho GTPase activation protein [Sporodiniella umbellata]|nr:Rho GTPase activation protein [Sporodiniella umbellata]
MDDNILSEVQKKNKAANSMKQHWEIIESYYVARLDSLQTEIAQNTAENHKLAKCRDELLKEVVRLTEKSTELSLKNESLSRIIAEKDNRVTAFMYQPTPEVTGVTLEDQPVVLTPPEDKPLPCKSESKTVKKEPGLFRQLSLRLSAKKRKQESIDSSPTPDSTSYSAVVEKDTVFGMELVEQARSEASKIPLVVSKCIEEVELRGLSTEGIYRKSGTYQHVKDLQAIFDQKDRNLVRLSDYDDIFVVTSVLKIYLRSLPSPLLSAEFIMPATAQLQQRINKTYLLLHTMPVEAYCTLKYLIQHLKRVHENRTVNRMTSKNLAVVFGPTLMRLAGGIVLGSEDNQMHEMIDTVDFIIMQSHVLFADFYP